MFPCLANRDPGKWCSLELATFARHVGTEKIDVLPLWLAPWLLNSILLDLLSVTLYEFLEHSFPNWSVAWTNPIMAAAESLLGENPATLKIRGGFHHLDDFKHLLCTFFFPKLLLFSHEVAKPPVDAATNG